MKTEDQMMNLANALAEAEIAATKAAEANSEDGGACNFDTAYFRLPRVRTEKVMRAAAAAGVRLDKRDHGGPAYFVHVTSRGQANLNSRCAEAARNALEAAGFHAAVYRALD